MVSLLVSSSLLEIDCAVSCFCFGSFLRERLLPAVVVYRVYDLSSSAAIILFRFLARSVAVWATFVNL